MSVKKPIMLNETGKEIVSAIMMIAMKSDGEVVQAATMVPYLIENYGARRAFNMWCKLSIELDSTKSLNDIVTDFYTNAQTGKVYGTEFYCFDVSNVSTGTKIEDNADMVCVPSTNIVAGRDDYADTALFMPININYNWDDVENLEPTITEIEGVTSGFSLTNPNGLVGVLQMGAWVYISNDGNKKVRRYSDTQVNGWFEPLPQCVRAKDNTFRPWMIHAKYIAGTNADGKLTSAAGLPPTTYSTNCRFSKGISHDGQIALWRQLGAAYSGGSMCDRTFLELMFEIKYARLGNSGLIEGCTNYNTMNSVAVAEVDTTRVIMAEAHANYYHIGSTVSVGTENDRSLATGHDVVDHYQIIRKKAITIDGVNYVAMYLDVPSTFTTEVGMYVIPEPWFSGSCDNVLGNDGSPYSLTDGKNPAKIQGIEFMTGAYEVLADTAMHINGEGVYQIYLNRRAANLKTGGAGDNAYILSETIPMKETASWNYIQEMGDSVEGFMVPTQTGSPASSVNGYRASCYSTESSSEAIWKEWLASGYLLLSGSDGVPCVNGSTSLSSANWGRAARASGSGGNRGEFGAA